MGVEVLLDPVESGRVDEEVGEVGEVNEEDDDDNGEVGIVKVNVEAEEVERGVEESPSPSLELT